MTSENSSVHVVHSDELQTNQGTQEQKEYLLYKYRFVVLIVFILMTNQNGMAWTVFLPLQTTLRDAFQVSITWVNFSTLLISNITYVPANFIGNYIVDTYGLKAGVLTGGLLTVIGCWIRVLSKYDFTWILIGQCFSGFAVPYFYSTPQKVSNVWFGPKERTGITTVIVCSMTFAVSFGTIVPFFVMDIHSDRETILSQFNSLMFWLAVASSIAFFLGVFFMKSKPKTPPSRAAAAKKHDFLKSLKTLLRNKNCMIMIASTSIIFSTISTYFGTIQQMVSPYGINGDSVGVIMSVASFIGVGGAALGAAIVQKIKKYNLVLIVTSILSFFVLIGNLIIAETGSSHWFGLSVIIFRSLMEPVLPISLEYGYELSFPIAESTAAGLWFVFNQLFATIESFIVDGILEHSNTREGARETFLLLIGMLILSIIPMFFVKENLRRENYEKKGLLPEGVKEEEVPEDNKLSPLTNA